MEKLPFFSLHKLCMEELYLCQSINNNKRLQGSASYQRKKRNSKRLIFDVRAGHFIEKERIIRAEIALKTIFIKISLIKKQVLKIIFK